MNRTAQKDTAMKYSHINIVAQNWRKLADFYIGVFGCKELFPHRDLHGAWIEQGTRVEGAHMQGAHLLLPGHGEDGPTLDDRPGSQRLNFFSLHFTPY
jgi:catechol 2,3-dioxygenase-like lactoylglutathione lyase family enzyme